MKKPTLREVAEYCGNIEQAELFFLHFESNGWKVGKNPMKSWKSAVSGWMKRAKTRRNDVSKAVSNTGTATVDKFWVRMAQIYGHKWTSNYGTEPTKPWIDLIGHMAHEKIAFGLTELIRTGDAWPPSLIEFNRMCQGFHQKDIKLLKLPDKEAVMEIREASKPQRLSAMAKITETLSVKKKLL